MKCCHPDALLICPHRCIVCRADEAQQLAAEIRSFERESKRDEEIDTGRAVELLAASRRLLGKIAKEAK